MDLVFNLVGNEYVAEFQATGDFNLHVERTAPGYLSVAQRGTESGQYAEAWAATGSDGRKVIDFDFGALVFPKWIKVSSESEVTSATVTFG